MVSENSHSVPLHVEGKGRSAMTIEELQEALDNIKGDDPISNARRLQILSLIYALQNAQE